MKGILCAVLACLLLCGCSGPAPETTEATHQPAVAPTEPSGSYEPGSKIEQETDGDVRAYPQNLGNIWAIHSVGDDLLVFSARDTTTITRLTGENLFRVAETQLDRYISPQSPSLYISENQIAYFSADTRELVFLNRDLRETKRMDVPGDIVGEPVLTSDRTRMYYCTASGVRCLDMETGISRLVKEMVFVRQYMTGLHMADTVLQVETMDGSGNLEILFLDAQTGALLGTLPEDMRITTGTDYFYAIDPEGTVNQMIFGTEQEVWQLTPENYLDSGVFLPEVHAAVVFDRWQDTLTMDYYCLSTGMRSASLTLTDLEPEYFAADGKGFVYFAAEQDGMQTICRWDVEASTTGDEQNHIGVRYTADASDTEGLAQCRAYAEALSRQFGIEIQLVTEAINLKPEKYDLIPEYQVPVIMDALLQLEQILPNYPEGMFAKTVEGLANGKLTLLLVRDVRGSYESGRLDSVDGLHFWLDDHSFVAICMAKDLEQTLHRNLFHALETRLLSESIALYRWAELNPKGFVYDCDSEEMQTRDTNAYFEDTTRSFVDEQSMQSPKEDRARVMAYACMPGNENYFISYTMQKKLRALCEGIREAYDLQDYTQPLLWEQYLESPINP